MVKTSGYDRTVVDRSVVKINSFDSVDFIFCFSNMFWASSASFIQLLSIVLMLGRFYTLDKVLPRAVHKTEFYASCSSS